MTLYYQDDHVTLHLGDSRVETAWLDADVLCTDPPYGMKYRAGGLHSAAHVRRAATVSIVADDDVHTRDEVLAMWGDTRPKVVFGTWRYPRPCGVINHRLIWHKAGRKPGIAPAAFFPVDEEIYLLGGGWVGDPIPTVITTTEVREQQPRITGHPTPKPLPLMEALIMRCPPGVIADPFAGSGSTLIAAKACGRRAIGVETVERYCEIAARRLAQDTLDFDGVSTR